MFASSERLRHAPPTVLAVIRSFFGQIPIFHFLNDSELYQIAILCHLLSELGDVCRFLARQQRFRSGHHNPSFVRNSQCEYNPYRRIPISELLSRQHASQLIRQVLSHNQA